MIIRRRHWLLAVTLFILAPLFGFGIGATFGSYFSDAPVQSEENRVERSAQNASTVLMPNGEQLELAELAPGRKVAVVVMKDAACPVCQRQLKVLSHRLDEVQNQGGAVFGLTDANRCASQKLTRRLGLNFPILSDPDHQVLGDYGLTLPEREYIMPGIIFIDEDGQVERVYRGRSPGEEQEDMILRWFQQR